MRRVVRILPFSLLILFLCVFVQPARADEMNRPPAAKSGFIDLSDWSFAEDGVVSLNGEWEFYWRQLLEPAVWSGASMPLGARYAIVPNVWREYSESHESVSNQGYATYRLVILLAKHDVGKPMAVYMPSVASAYKLWINGNLAASNGVVAVSQESMVPKNIPKVVPFLPQAAEVELVVQVSNFVQRKGGLWEEIRVGESGQIRMMKNRLSAVEIGAFSCLIMMAFYHFGLYFIRRKDRSPLYFGGLCLSIGCRISMLGQTLAVHLFPSLPWETAVKIEYISSIASILFLVLFIHRQYPEESVKSAPVVSLILNGFFIAFVLFTPALIYTHLLVTYELIIIVPTLIYVFYVYVTAAVRRRTGSVLNGVGFLAFGSAAAVDMLFYSQFIHTGNILHFGLLGYLFTQSVNMALNFARSYRKTESLSRELRQLKDTLEEHVEARTAELKQINERMEQRNAEMLQLEQSQRRWLSIVSRELETPLASVQRNIQMMLQGTIEDSDNKVLKQVYDQTLMLNRTIQDLLDLSKLEANQMQFYVEFMPAGEFFRSLFDKCKLVEKQSGCRLKMGPGLESYSNSAAISVDPIRIEQVFSHLVRIAANLGGKRGIVTVDAETVTMPDASRAGVKLTLTVVDGAADFPCDLFDRRLAMTEISPIGTGLELMISKHLVEHHRGLIGMERDSARGGRLYMILPLLTAAELQEEWEEGQFELLLPDR